MRKARPLLLVLLCLVAVACSAESGEEGSSDTGGSVAGGSPSGKQGQGSNAALVPVTHFTSQKEDITVEKLSGTPDLAVPGGSEERADGILEDPDVETFESPGGVIDYVSRTRGAVGLVPWGAVSPRVKVLSVGGESLLEPGGDYPFPGSGPDSEKLRRVVVGGDVMMDRGMYLKVIREGKGLDHPMQGGYATVTQTATEPSSYSEFGVIHKFDTEQQGESGAVKEYLNSADLTLANLENPVVEDATWHPNATTFTGNPELMPVLEKAGIDGVSLANNHTLDAGASGLRQTRGYLEEAGISYAGAGMDLASAREPMIFDLGGVKVGVLGYQGVPYYQRIWAGEDTAGTAPMLEDMMREDVRALKERVDFVAVMPHWGQEYTATPEPGQVEFAHAAVEAGADLVVGGHPHWPKGMEFYRGDTIFYSTGNFLFDQVWSLETSTGIFAEVTLYEDRIVQARPRPFVILDRSQPNFLTEGGWRERTMQTIFDASRGDEFKSSGSGWAPSS